MHDRDTSRYRSSRKLSSVPSWVEERPTPWYTWAQQQHRPQYRRSRSMRRSSLGQ